VAASTFGFLIDGIETKFLRADWTSEFSRSQDPSATSLSNWRAIISRILESNLPELTGVVVMLLTEIQAI
jgi:hypothetical protein